MKTKQKVQVLLRSFGLLSITAVISVSSLPLTTTAAISVKNTTQQPASVDIKVMTFNTSGTSRHPGYSGDTATFVSSVTADIKQYLPDTVGLQQVCQAQAAALRKSIAPLGYKLYYTTTNTYPYCIGNGKRWGLVLAVKTTSVDHVKIYNLPVPTKKQESLSEPRKILCLTGVVLNSKKTIACTTHFSQYQNRVVNQGRETQAAWTLKNVLKPYTKNGQSLIFAGDFNLDTDTPSIQSFKAVFTDPAMFAGGPTATKQPVAPATEGVPIKIDHTFWTGTLRDRTTFADPKSDHRGVISWGTLTDSNVTP